MTSLPPPPPRPLSALPAAALRAVLREGYGAPELRRDVLAGLVVGVVAVPLSMALAIGAGVAPQHGLATAVVAGFVVALLGGSRTQVTGPTAAFIVVLAPIHAQFGLAGLLLSGVMAGGLLMAMGLLRLGRYIEFIPHPVTTGFTAGIATVIATLQLKDVLGLAVPGNPDHFLERVWAIGAALPTAQWDEVLVAGFTLTLLLRFPTITRAVPAPLVALPLAALLAWALTGLVPGFEVATIASRFSTEVAGQMVPGIPRLPPLPLWPWLQPGGDGAPFVATFASFRALFSGAVAVALLAAIESLLSAVVADGLTRTRHDPDAELLALGVGNVVTPFFGGIPATGAFARTATSIRAGGRSPVAAMTHALTVLVAMVALAPLLGHLPMAALAALLLLVAWNMSEAKLFVRTVTVAPRSDVAVLLTCYVLTVLFDMVLGVSVGLMMAALLFMHRMAEVTQGRRAGPGHPELPDVLPEGVEVYEISGPLFFGAAQKALSTLDIIAGQTRALVLVMDEVHAMDATGLVALQSALEPLLSGGCLVVLAGVRGQPLAVLRRAGMDLAPGLAFSPTARAALQVVEERLAPTSSPA